jgi:peroxiredoxin
MIMAYSMDEQASKRFRHDINDQSKDFVEEIQANILQNSNVYPIEDNIREMITSCQQHRLEAVFPDASFGEVILFDDEMDSWIALYFYEHDFGHSQDLISLSLRAHEFAAIHVKLMAASADSKYSHFAWIRAEPSAGGIGRLNYPLIADFDKSLCRRFSVLQSNGTGMHLLDNRIVPHEPVL